MSRSTDTSPDISYRWLALGLLFVLLCLPRFAELADRPVMHDESLFGYYAYRDSTDLGYTHLPILHGPAMIKLTSLAFWLSWDSMAIARGLIAFCSVLCILGILLVAPRRTLPWAIPLTCLSPTFTFFGRFFHEDFLFSAVLSLSVVGLVSAHPHPVMRMSLRALGAAGLVVLLAIKENAVFTHATGVTFLVILAIWKWMSCAKPELVRALRTLRRRRIPVVKTSKKSKPRPPRGADPHRVFRMESVIALAGGLVLGCFLTVLIYHLAAAKDSNGLMAMKDSWDYWLGQHREHRISGFLHHHLPILLTYELPLLVLIYAGIFLDAITHGRRLLLHLVSISGCCLGWLLLRVLKDAPGFHGALHFLHIEVDGSLLVLGLLIVPILIWTFLMLIEHRRMAAFFGYWSACSLFQYSVAGEKVPWLTVHIAQPMYFMLPWIWGVLDVTSSPRGRRFFSIGMAVSIGLAIRADIPLIWTRAGDPRERVVYNHTTRAFQDFCDARVAYWKTREATVPLNQRRVLFVSDPGWPGFWYLRKCAYVPVEDAPKDMKDGYDLIMGPEAKMKPLIDSLDPAEYNSGTFSLRDHWMADWPEKDPLISWVRYYWYRQTWTPPGGFPISYVEPRCPR